MIQIDMDRPRRCLECPAAYMVTYGEYTGTDICNVMNYKGVSPAECTVNLNERPDWCPMKEQNHSKNPNSWEQQEIVRCRDCKYLEHMYALDDLNGKKCYVCRKHSFTGLREEDWFCADGERKKEG